MVAQKHFQRLKQMYTSDSTRATKDSVAIVFGRAELRGTLDAVESEVVVNRMPHHRLLSDAASLAAASLEKEHVVTAEHFTVDVVDPEYEGPVVVTAEVVMAEPPRYVVEAQMLGEEDTLVADAMGSFHPSETDLPSLPDTDHGEEEKGTSTPSPASFMPVHTTPYGMLCLN